MKRLDFSVLRNKIRNHKLAKDVITDIILPKGREYIFGDGVHLRTYLERCLVKNGTYDSKTIVHIVEAFIGYLEAPLIFDTCENHRERRAWQEKMEKVKPEYRNILKKNRLSRSMILNVITIFENILSEHDRKHTLKNSIVKGHYETIKHQLKVYKTLEDGIPESHRIVLATTVTLFTRNVIVRMMELYKQIPEGVAL